MKTIFYLFLTSLIIAAEPLKIVENTPSAVSKEKSEELRTVLQNNMTKSRVTIQQMSPLLGPEMLQFLPNGNLYKLSAVVMDPATQHGALIDFVIYEQKDKQLILPVSGNDEKFCELLKLADKKIKNEKDARILGRVYAKIYGINFIGDPEIKSEKNCYLVRFTLRKSTNPSEEKNIIELSIEVNDEHSANKVGVKK